MNAKVDVKMQVSLALKALEAVLPYAEAAGIEANYETSYDEWDGIVQAIFTSFVVLPLCDTTGTWAPHMFQRFGFELQSGKFVIAADYGNDTMVVFDAAKASDGRLRLVLRPLEGGLDTLAVPCECSCFRVEALGAVQGASSRIT